MAIPVEHDVEVTAEGVVGYATRCTCGWQRRADIRRDALASWWDHVLHADAAARLRAA